MAHSHPSFDSLLAQSEGPIGNAWKRFGEKSDLGMLNLLTPETVASAAKEIQSGVRISLDWPLDMPSYPSFGRPPFQHEVRNKPPSDGSSSSGIRAVNDDFISFNTQCSSQWDSFRHYGENYAQFTAGNCPGS